MVATFITLFYYELKDKKYFRLLYSGGLGQ